MKDSSTSGNLVAIIAIVVVIALLGGFIYWYKTQSTPAEPIEVPVASVHTNSVSSSSASIPAAKPIAAPIEPSPPPPEPIQETVENTEPAAEESEPAVSLPPLNDSDAFVSEQLSTQSEQSLMGLIVPDEVVRKSVRAIIGVANNRLVNQYRPVLSPMPTLGVSQISGGEDAEYELTEANFRRYDKHIALMQSFEPATLASVFDKLEPLLSEAYAEQGLDGSFREVVISAIDNLLATPDIDKTIILTRPAVMFKYADPELEALPEPQKLMLRMGPDNRGKVKSYLSAFKKALSEN
ncbi:DUF3014 domain-containing protein [Gilvimarinus sp. 1_MG-2023]|uniref:DUF3014 domain-containing protein n=1 Tax=Gilvimarinus sp. 1_MG-2023 TaxID=3062638 RepID=UPI0026E1FE4F|nr:DUF3014 domain-containing protein [Gilvimarinus sp. 1_MG-2023]MDO6747644.1 DUF3014 domain-containing protein [Gilvimarinus sp. 1_MG-2023]